MDFQNLVRDFVFACGVDSNLKYSAQYVYRGIYVHPLALLPKLILFSGRTTAEKALFFILFLYFMHERTLSPYRKRKKKKRNL